jgi:hypothetical protein
MNQLRKMLMFNSLVNKLLPPCTAFLWAVVLGFSVGFARVAMAQELPPLEIVQIAPFSFGAFSVEGGGGAITVDARSGACAPRGGVVMLKQLCDRGQFEVRGQAGAQLMVEVLPGVSNVAGIELRNLQLYPAENIITLGLDGKARIQVGGELVAHGASRDSTFNASYMVSVNYLQ